MSGGIRDKAEAFADPPTLVGGGLQQFPFRQVIIFAGHLVGAGEGGEGVQIVAAPAIHVAQRQVVIVAIGVVSGIAQRGQLGFGTGIVPLLQICVGQANRGGLVTGAGLPRFLIVAAGKIKILNVHEQVGGLDKVVGGDRSSFSHARFGERQTDLLAGIIPFAFVHEDVSDGQASLHAIGVRRVQRAGEAVHGGIAVAQSQ